MDINTDQYERIINFLDANMTLEEMDAFEKELEANPAMRQQLDFELQARDSFAFNKNKIIDNTTNTTPIINISRKRKKWFAIAAAAAITITLVSIIFLKPKKDIEKNIVQVDDTNGIKKNDTAAKAITQPSPDSTKATMLTKLYQQYFTMDTIPENYPMYLADALTNYQNEDYAAIKKLNLNSVPEIRGTEGKQSALELGHYYKGIAFLKTNITKEAILNLQWVQNNSADKNLQLKAQWYLALAHLKNNNTTEATNLLKKIANKSTYDRYKTKAKILLKALE